jgi:hypothetical protein
LARRLVEDRTVEVFDRRSPEIGEFHRRLQRLRNRVEEDNAEEPASRLRHHTKDCRSDPRQSPFAARHQLGQISWYAQGAVESVARPPLDETLRQPLGDGLSMVRDDFVGGLSNLGKIPTAIAHNCHRSIGEHDFEGGQVIAGCSIDRSVGPGRVVGDHPAEGGARGGRNIGPEPTAVWREFVVELIEHHPGPNPHRTPLRIEVRNTAVVAGEINHQPTAEGTAGKTGPRPARRDLDTALGSRFQEIGRLGSRAGEGDRRRFDAVDRSVNRIQAPCEHIGADLAA